MLLCNNESNKKYDSISINHTNYSKNYLLDNLQITNFADFELHAVNEFLLDCLKSKHKYKIKMDEKIRFIETGTTILPHFSVYSKLPDIDNFSKDISQVNYEQYIHTLGNYKNIKTILDCIHEYKKKSNS